MKKLNKPETVECKMCHSVIGLFKGDEKYNKKLGHHFTCPVCNHNNRITEELKSNLKPEVEDC